jgi:hypothetical protein
LEGRRKRVVAMMGDVKNAQLDVYDRERVS